ncbi:hypothetical protein VTN49DRAFT_6336 [Thermomyces lanuginosus]|uniref:uncharacterized protein n=1 Tax=Thermomyces lanuginosus TaxID=5541 RepID=UPI0037444475
MSLSPEERESYTKIIDSILAESDLQTVSEKRIRRGLQDAVGRDLTEQKAAIKELIMERFDIFASQADQGSTTPAEAVNGHNANGKGNEKASASPSSSPQKRPAENERPEDAGSKSPKAKRQKPDHDIEADALFAAKLQAEENKRARPTRGSANRKTTLVKKKAKTAKKVRAEDDSGLDSSSEAGKKEVNRSGGFHKPLLLSPALSELLDGETALSRPQAVKRVWQYIRDNDLQDPTDRRHIRCDDRMRAVFKQDRVHMFTMTKILNQNLYSPDE